MKKKKNEVAFKKDNVLFETKSKEETLDYFNSNIEMGLNDHEVKTRRDEYGENKLAEKKKKTILRVFLEQLNDPMIYILIAAAVISFVVIPSVSTIKLVPLWAFLENAPACRMTLSHGKTVCSVNGTEPTACMIGVVI